MATPENQKTKDGVVAAIEEFLKASPAEPAEAAQILVNSLDKIGVLALNSEWDVEYRENGIVSRHTEDAFEEAELTYAQAEEYASSYNALEGAHGTAVVVRRFVSEFREV